VPRTVYIDPNLKNFGYALDAEGKAFEIANLERLREVERSLDALKRGRDKTCLKNGSSDFCVGRFIR
jgi:putative transposase